MLLCPLGVVGGVECGGLVGVSTGVVLGDPWGFPITDASIKDELIMVVACCLRDLNGGRLGTPPSNGGRSIKVMHNGVIS